MLFFDMTRLHIGQWLSRLKIRLQQSCGSSPKQQDGNTLIGKYYTRLGQCHSCGQCCSNVHLAYGGVTIKNAQALAEVQKTSAVYRYFRAGRQTEAGIFVGCIHLMPNRKCAIYEHRPRFCREYPSEIGILAGAELAPNCGYSFRPNIAFQAVLKKLIHS